MKKNPLKALGSCFMGVTLAASMVPMAAGTASAEPASPYWEAPSQAVTIDTSKILKTYGVRAGSAGPDFVGITNTNYDFTSGKAGQTDQYAYQETDFQGTKAAGLAIWATSVNENVNPFYANLMYSGLTGATVDVKATSWMSNPGGSSWGDSNNTDSVKASDGSATKAGLEFNPEIIFGAEKMTNWGNFDNSDTNIYKQVAVEQAAGSTYDPTYTNNDSTNLWTQVHTINQLAKTADEVKGDLTTRYDDNSAAAGALAYENSLRGNLLWIASQIDAKQVKKKTVAYLYAIDDAGTGYFFIPEASGLLKGDDTGKTTTSKVDTPDANYAANNGTIDLDYMDTLPFITNTFKNGTAVEGGIVMKCEDIYKTNPAVSVAKDAKDSPLADVDVIIYNSTKNTNLQGTNGGKNESNINNAAALNDTIVKEWAQALGYAGKQIIAGDDYGTSNQQNYGTKDATENGMSPMLYCQRNYTTDKPARAVWAYSQVYPELYKSADDSYAYWVDKVYHVNTADVAKVVKYMTNQSDTVTYTNETAAYLEQCYQAGIEWWETTGSAKEEWNQYAYYNGSSRASYYSGNAASEEPENLIGIFAPSTSMVGDTTGLEESILSANTTKASVQVSVDGTDVPNTRVWVKQSDQDALVAAIDAATEVVKSKYPSQAKIDAAVDALADAVAAFVAAEQPGTYLATRLSGDTRYDTMAAIVEEGFDTSEVAILATGANYPDALAASALAGVNGAPIILTESDQLTAQAKAELDNLGVKTVYILGGRNAVSASVFESLVSSGYGVQRVYGDSRQATSLAIYNQVLAAGATGDTVVIASGSGFADALSISPYSYKTGTPILLTDNDGALTEDEVAAIKGNSSIKKVIIVGGTGVVNDSVKTQLGEDAYEYTRLAGENRYETSNAIADWEIENGMSAEMTSVATGVNFPDALAGAAFTGSKNGILLLAADGSTDQAVSVISVNKSAVKNIYVYGGTGAVPDAVVSTCVEAAK